MLEMRWRDSGIGGMLCGAGMDVLVDGCAGVTAAWAWVHCCVWAVGVAGWTGRLICGLGRIRLGCAVR